MTSNRLDAALFALVCGIGLYLPFEPLILRYAAGGDFSYVIMRSAVELVLYASLALVLARQLIFGRSLASTPVNWPLACFFLVAVASGLLNGSELLPSLAVLRNLTRYLAVFYILVHLRVEPRQIRSFFVALVVLGAAQGALGMLQSVAGDSLREPFFQRDVDMEIAGKVVSSKDPSSQRQGAALGTLGQPGVLAFFELLTLVLLFVDCTRPRVWRAGAVIVRLVLALLIFGGLVATTKRAPVFLGVAIPILGVWLVGQRWRPVLIAGLLAGVAGLGILLLSSVSFEFSTASEARERRVAPGALMLHLLSPDYWENSARSSRLWFLRSAAEDAIGSVNLFGYGPDEVKAIGRLVDSNPGELRGLLAYVSFKDVYWATLLVQFGILGLGCWLAMFESLRRAARTLRERAVDRDSIAFQVGLALSLLIVVTLAYTLVERTLLIRTYAFYLWMLAGVAVNFEQRSRRLDEARLTVGSGRTA